jgi:hypothetical protein
MGREGNCSPPGLCPSPDSHPSIPSRSTEVIKAAQRRMVSLYWDVLLMLDLAINGVSIFCSNLFDVNPRLNLYTVLYISCYHVLYALFLSGINYCGVQLSSFFLCPCHSRFIYIWDNLFSLHIPLGQEARQEEENQKLNQVPIRIRE